MALQPAVLAPHSSGPEGKTPVAGAQVLPLLAVWQPGRLSLSALYCAVPSRPVPCPACLALGQDGYCTYRAAQEVPGAAPIPCSVPPSRIHYIQCLALHRPALNTWATPTDTITSGPGRLLLNHHNSTALPMTTTDRAC